MKLFLYFVLVLLPTTFFSQEANYKVSDIPAELKENANAVVRLRQVDIVISSQRNMNTKEKRVVTVFNEYGLSYINSLEHYDKNTKIKKIEATVFNSVGTAIKSIKRKDFKDVSVGDGFSVFTDNRMVYYDYVPVNYPFTIVYESEVETSNTAFIPTWSPVEGYTLSVEKSNINITTLLDLGLKSKELNFSSNYDIKKEESQNKISYVASNLKAPKYEELSPPFLKIFPNVMLGLNSFHLEGIDGSAESWTEMGNWFSNSILVGTSELPESTKLKIKELVGSEIDDLKKAKIVYDFVQQKTRYVSIQEGIGGWKPMLAKDVDRLGYGDCKALSNYTKALLDAVGVTSYYTRLYGDDTKKSVVSDFVSMQSNHVILAIPNGSNYIWLECTSQTNPFGFQGTFTDHRNVLVLKPEGGEIVQTHEYLPEDNTQLAQGKYKIDVDGKISGVLSIKSKGTQYEDKYLNKNKSATSLDAFYKDYFENINNLKLAKLNFVDNKDAVEFIENIEVEADNYADTNNDRMMFVINAFNVNSNTPKRYRTRENPFEISRGYSDQDELVISFPKNYTIEAIPNAVELKTKYGEYQVEFTTIDANSISYKRKLMIKDGYYESKDYNEYRLFREQILKNDNAKIVLIKKQ